MGRDQSVDVHHSLQTYCRAMSRAGCVFRSVSIVAILVIVGVACGAYVYSQFARDLAIARSRSQIGSQIAQTPCGTIEYQSIGRGAPLLVVHGSGGGFDQGIAFSQSFVDQGIRAIAMSRFGYLRTPMPVDHSPEAQADAHACLLDTLGIAKVSVVGASAGAPSAIQFAIRHPKRVNALLLLVPIAYKPTTVADSAPPLSPLVESVLSRLIGSDFVFWLGLNLARDQIIRTVMATPPQLVHGATEAERKRVGDMAERILPVSTRRLGLRADTLLGNSLGAYPLHLIRAPTLVVSARDDGFGTYASAKYTAGQIKGAKFIGFDQGGHLWVGHDDQVRREIAAFTLQNAED
jgi:2-hydroxy-6-oxonona-2,4-dienedioate hydrolase